MESVNPLGVCFNLMKMRYQTYDSILTDLRFLEPTDKVNVFINLETALKYISMTKDLEKKLMTCPEIDSILVSDIINLAAHYKDFFRGNGLETNIFLYMTDLSSEMDDFMEKKYNDDYRSYYLIKYMGNPKFVLLGKKLNEVILPEVRKICEYIPNVYLVSKKGVDSGVIPDIVSSNYPDWKNIVISGDMHDTQYGYYDNFLSHYYVRGYNTNIFASTPKGYLQAITRRGDIPEGVIDLFTNAAMYRLLLCCTGDRYRSIPDIPGIKFGKLLSCITTSLKDRKITTSTSNAMLLADIFPEECKADIFSNMMMVDIRNKVNLLGEGVKKDILTQIVDKVDVTSLQKLNATAFQKFPLRLEGLLR